MTAPPRRILIVRTSALGDVARTVPALVRLRRTFPDAAIDWLVHEDYADVIRQHPDLHQTLPFPRRRFAALPGLVRRLRAARYDLAVDLEGQARSALLTWLSGAPVRVGYANAREGGFFAYNRTARVSKGLHAVNRMLTLLHACRLTSPDAPADMSLHVPPDAFDWHDRHIGAFGGTTGGASGGTSGGYVAIAPTAQALCKCWPIDRFADVARRLRERGLRIVVLAAPREQAYVQPLVDAAEAACPQTTVAQLMATIARARLLLCNDSAALHIAVGLGTPAVALFGPTDPALVGPYRRPRDVIQPPAIRPQDMAAYRHLGRDQTLISRISTNQVWHRIEHALNP